MSLLAGGAPFYDAEYDVTYTEGELRGEIIGTAVVGGICAVLSVGGLLSTLYLRRTYPEQLNAPKLLPNSLTMTDIVNGLRHESPLGAADLGGWSVGGEGAGSLGPSGEGAMNGQPQRPSRASDDVAVLWKQRRLLAAMLPSIGDVMPDLEAREYAAFETLMRRAREVEVLDISLASGTRTNPLQTERTLDVLDAQLAEGVKAHAALVQAAAVVYAEVVAVGSVDAPDGDELRRTQEALEAAAAGLREANAINREILDRA
ncbi:hypothetical protein EK0264_00690 [Epidermidibacterium keratini]|uniref:Uncharacterized protein n=1 Tax=Epidermidibacterium keratini TaxID=1891644 RepID=A0A7L4YK92_9ACTN|nr:hypothetical protein [Epidermidibacterium keratini]QHB98956.1 hypothetical protein EK0264_00690 [Epidermidibacterium keratini]